jgi:hypothetical protein
MNFSKRNSLGSIATIPENITAEEKVNFTTQIKRAPKIPQTL